jgi:hypothetical protein
MRFEREMDVLFRGWPVLFALSCELREPGSHRAGYPSSWSAKRTDRSEPS